MEEPAKVVVERLIAYWRGLLAGTDIDSCAKLVAELAASMSAMELLAMQGDPLLHRRQIEERVAAWQTTRERTRHVAASGAAASEGREEVTLATYENGRLRAAEPVPSRQLAPARIQVDQRVTHGMAFGMLDAKQGGIHFNLPGLVTPSGSPQPSVATEMDCTMSVLFLGANPANSTRLRLDEEVREIDRALSSAELGRRCVLNQRWAVRASEIHGYLLRTKPTVLHFSGHGECAGIVLEGDDGDARPISAAQLARLLGQFNERLRCVVLNACYTAGQAEAFAEQIDCVIGMSAAVIDRAAIRFAAAFYRAVAFGYSIKSAFDQACSEPEVGELGQDRIPRLLARRCDPAQLVLVRELNRAKA